MSDIREKIGHEVRRLRKDLALQQAELATMAEVKDFIVIKNIESGKDNISIDQIRRVLAVLNCKQSPEEFGLLDKDTNTGLNTPKLTKNPYKGLAAYSENDAEFFFGREAFVDSALRSLEENCAIFIVGPSGIGKSSAVKAGLLPATTEKKQLTPISIRPGTRPVNELASAIIRKFRSETIGEVSSVTKSLIEDATLFFMNLKSRSNSTSGIIIYIDQFEELFSPKCDTSQVESFISIVRNLCDGTSQTEWDIKIVLTVRADFYPQMLSNSNLTHLLNEQKFISYGPMTDEELKDAISKPAEVFGRKISGPLTTKLLSIVTKKPNSLPLMAYCLHNMWEISKGTSIGIGTYNQIGGIEGAIAKRAEQLYQDESPLCKAAIKKLFSKLVTVASDGSRNFEMRARVGLATVAPDAVESAMMQKLIDARLLTADIDEPTNDRTVELTHEAIMLGWQRLRTWLDEDHEFIRWTQTVSPLVSRWIGEGKSSELLLSGKLLLEGTEWLADRSNDMATITLEFLKASISIDEQKREIEASSKIDVILSAHPSRLVDRIEEARILGYLDPKFLRRNISKTKNDENNWKLKLAALSYDTGQIRHIIPKLETCAPDELVAICHFLKPHAEDVLISGQLDLTEPNIDDQIFIRRASALTLMAKPLEEIDKFAPRICKILSTENPLLVRDFVIALRGIRQTLFQPLIDIVDSNESPRTVQDTAALVLLDFFEGEPTYEVKILSCCSIEVFNVAIRRLYASRSRDQDLSNVLSKELSNFLEQAPSNLDLKTSKKIARVAATLAKVGHIDDANRLLASDGLTDAKAQYAFQVAPVGVDKNDIAEAFVASDQLENIYWLGIALGEYELRTLDPLTRQGLLECLTGRYADDPRATSHSICGWLLHQLGESETADRIDQEESSLYVDNSREWFNLATPLGLIPFVNIPPGKYTRGAPEGEIGFAPYEGPQHEVEVETHLAVAARGVTVSDFQAFCNASEDNEMPLNIAPFSPDGNHPIVSITWNEANAFCEWLGTETVGRKDSFLSRFQRQPKMRLPTELEWEYFCRAGTTTAFSFGSDINLLEKFGWYQENSGFKMQPYKLLRPNPWGIFDIHGNCWEWCGDPYKHFEGTLNVAPLEGDEDLRPLKGGGWNLHYRYCRSACRNWHNASNRNYYTGMRLIIEVE